MDLYISDSMQDMLDIDIRSEVATVVGGVSEFSSLMNYDLPSLDLDTNSNDCDISWLSGPKWSATTNSTDIYADVGACVNPNSVMPVITSSILNSPKGHVNLNSNSRQHDPLLPSPKEKKSHLTFSPNTIKVPVVQENRKSSSFIQPQRISSNIDLVKKDLSDDMKDEKKTITSSSSVSTTSFISSAGAGNTIKLAAGIGGLTFANNMAYTKLKQSNHLKSGHHHHLTTSGQSILQKRDRDTSSTSSSPQNFNQLLSNHHQQHNGGTTTTSSGASSSSGTGYHHQLHQSNSNGHNTTQTHQKIFKSGLITSGGNKQHIFTTSITNGVQQNGHHVHHINHHHNGHSNTNNSNTSANNKLAPQPTGQEFPKPAYSYSCLIAMALKNSRAGSLPVSEIYSFMCEHFPYFKTAPNGWKNSVRHNLSLNKCFEKIEKPATNGGQRKGCLWAMNPAKISKMDEEVQKWSRKDPMAIRKAMVFPDHLEALERGEMKHGSTGDSDGEAEGPSDTEEQSDSEAEPEVEESIIIPASSYAEEEEGEIEAEFDVEVSFFNQLHLFKLK